MSQRFRLVCDDDGHSFLCPDGREGEANSLFEEITTYWESTTYKGNPPTIPDWLEPVDNPYRLSFTDPKEDA